MPFGSFEVWSLEFVYDNSTVFCLLKRQEILQLCDNRWVLFDNKTKYEAKRTEQVQQLLSLVNTVNVKNGGQPYTNECFAELKLAEEQATRLKEEEVAQLAQRKSNEEIHKLRENLERAQRETEDQLHKSYEDRIKRTTEMVESKLKEMTTRLEQQLAKEQATRLKGEEVAQLAQRKSNDEIHKLRENLERAQRETEDQMHESYEDQIKRITEMVESKLKETTIRLEQQLEEEHAARLKADGATQLAQMKSNDEIRKLRENLERAEWEAEELRKRAEKEGCAIL
ncbi:hypothetical protein CUMW_213190 [Citrus unshiu]|uniref:AIG1-type G domain-containing protein n=1 Tax=Citrus unshiu TaxID=55188 RepID=A0A2H5QB41_CITUN|nr:hypothetical protein CUMW_213190 [Citrus unshiu]